MAIEVFARQEDILGEGPLWCAAEGFLYWIDIALRRLHRKALTGQQTHWELGARPGCVENLCGGRLILALGDGIYEFLPVTGETRLVRRVRLAPGTRFNEGKADPRGRLWFGSMQDNFGPNDEDVSIDRSIGQLFCLGHGADVTVMDQGIGISNTLAWSPDGTRFYFADSLASRICVYDYVDDTGAISNKRVLFDNPGFGVPDGSAMDVDGCLWNARWGAGRLLRITPEGRIDREIEIPALQTSSCAFGGPDLKVLFVTSARIGMCGKTLSESPLSGSVFAIEGIAQGFPVPCVRLTF